MIEGYYFPLSNHQKKGIKDMSYTPYNQHNQQQQQKAKIIEIRDATIKVGEYQVQGVKKNKYMNIGTLFIYEGGGMSLKLDAVPTNAQSINLYPRKQKPQQNHKQQGY